jgi:hypothetical protein
MPASAAQQFYDMAATLVADLENRRPALEAELQKIKTRERDIDAELRATHLGRKRLGEFAVKIGMDYQCPRCWVRDETRTTLRPVSSKTKDDHFACDTCGLDVLIVMGL